jgi:hypothetical protein
MCLVKVYKIIKFEQQNDKAKSHMLTQVIIFYTFFQDYTLDLLIIVLKY